MRIKIIKLNKFKKTKYDINNIIIIINFDTRRLLLIRNCRDFISLYYTQHMISDISGRSHCFSRLSILQGKREEMATPEKPTSPSRETKTKSKKKLQKSNAPAGDESEAHISLSEPVTETENEPIGDKESGIEPENEEPLQGETKEPEELESTEPAEKVYVDNKTSEEETDKGPVDDDKGPVDEDKGPVDEDKGQVDDDKGPVDDDKGLVDSDKGPLDDDKEPVDSDKGPVDDDKEPVDDDVKPEKAEDQDETPDNLEEPKQALFVVEQNDEVVPDEKKRLKSVVLEPVDEADHKPALETQKESQSSEESSKEEKEEVVAPLVEPVKREISQQEFNVKEYIEEIICKAWVSRQ